MQGQRTSLTKLVRPSTSTHPAYSVCVHLPPLHLSQGCATEMPRPMTSREPRTRELPRCTTRTQRIHTHHHQTDHCIYTPPNRPHHQTDHCIYTPPNRPLHIYKNAAYPHTPPPNRRLYMHHQTDHCIHVTIKQTTVDMSIACTLTCYRGCALDNTGVCP